MQSSWVCRLTTLPTYVLPSVLTHRCAFIKHYRERARNKHWSCTDTPNSLLSQMIKCLQLWWKKVKQVLIHLMEIQLITLDSWKFRFSCPHAKTDDQRPDIHGTVFKRKHDLWGYPVIRFRYWNTFLWSTHVFVRDLTCVTVIQCNNIQEFFFQSWCCA